MSMKSKPQILLWRLSLQFKKERSGRGAAFVKNEAKNPSTLENFHE